MLGELDNDFLSFSSIIIILLIQVKRIEWIELAVESESKRERERVGKVSAR